jgi:hypothetical protein
MILNIAAPPSTSELAMPFAFTGDNDIDDWVNELNEHFATNNVQQAQMLPTAMLYLSVDVRSAVHRVQQIIGFHLIRNYNMNIDALRIAQVEGGWNWTYPRLVSALQGMQSERFSIPCTQETRHLIDMS